MTGVDTTATDEPPSLRQMWAWSREILETDDVDSRRIRAAVLIMACCVGCGPRLRVLRDFTGIPVSDVHRVSYYLRRAQIWGDGWFRAPWLEDTDPVWPIDFVMHVMTATGELISADGETFRLRTVGTEFGADPSEEGSGIPWSEFMPARPVPVKDGVPVWLRNDPDRRYVLPGTPVAAEPEPAGR